MDALGGYTGGTYKQHLSKREIEKMKRNMKKVPIIALKSDRYHLKEEVEAEKILSKLHDKK